MVDYKTIIENLNLQSLDVEGGFFDKIITLENDDGKEIGSSIYYLVTPDSFSSLHKVLKDEIWYFLEGDPLLQVTYDEINDEYKEIVLDKVSNNGIAVNLVDRNIWQSTILKEGGEWALVATAVVPGFEHDDFISYNDEILNKLKNHCDINKFIY